MQDVGFRISALYRQQQMAIGILDLSTKEDLVETLRWYTENMNMPLYVITLQSRIDEADWQDEFPDVNFIIFKLPATTGEYINAFADECYATYFLVVRTDSVLVAFDGERLMHLMGILPTLRAPYIKGRQVDPASFTPTADADVEEDNLYPVMELGLYDRALFQRLRSYDTLISGEFYQAMDFGVRCFLLGHRIFTRSPLFSSWSQDIHNQSSCDTVPATDIGNRGQIALRWCQPFLYKSAFRPPHSR